MKANTESAKVSPALTVSAIISLLVGVWVACPVPDLFALIIGLAVALIPFLILLGSTIRIVRTRGIHPSYGVAIRFGIGISSVLLSVLVLRIV